ncbi:MAG: SDR family NAD(P)-dependent oxidoreductase [Bacteroidota bacterium]|nr:SDR family NAD(P)-dependent oxidoreductase [Bacteroidota bacterium]
MKKKPTLVGDGTPFNALVTAVRDLRSQKHSEFAVISEDTRIDGTTCFVTGANSGLGKAAAVELARRGGNMILACRPGHSEISQEVANISGSTSVELVEVDLSDIKSVQQLCDLLAFRNIQIDIALLNAGLMPPKARKSPQGFEIMFAVHFLSSRIMIDRWLEDGVIRPSAHPEKTPRIVFVSSEAHRSSHMIDFDRLGEFTDYRMKESLKYYGISKLLQSMYATQLSRHLNRRERVEVAVHSMCPGGIASNIARDTPVLLKPVIKPLLRYLLQSPEEAINPVIYLCCSKEAGATTGMYLHLMQRKSVSPTASNPENGSLLWKASADLMQSIGAA